MFEIISKLLSYEKMNSSDITGIAWCQTAMRFKKWSERKRRFSLLVNIRYVLETPILLPIPTNTRLIIINVKTNTWFFDILEIKSFELIKIKSEKRISKRSKDPVIESAKEENTMKIIVLVL